MKQGYEIRGCVDVGGDVRQCQNNEIPHFFGVYYAEAGKLPMHIADFDTLKDAEDFVNTSPD